MPNSKKNAAAHRSYNELDVEKEVVFYGATLEAWYTTRFERDRSLLSLSAAAVGLLVTLATAVGASNVRVAVLYALALLSFVVCICAILKIFSRNAVYLQSMLLDGADRDKLLVVLDKVAITGFIFGVIFTIFIGLFSAFENFYKEEVVVAKDSKKMVSVNNGTEKRSVDGVSALRPKPSPDKSGGQGDKSNNSDSKK